MRGLCFGDITGDELDFLYLIVFCEHLLKCTSAVNDLYLYHGLVLFSIVFDNCRISARDFS